MIVPPRMRAAICGVAILGLLGIGCVTSRSAGWAGNIAEAQRAEVLGGLPAEARRTLIPLSEIFYSGITSRRFNSRSTFEDPSMRQFFPTVAAYSDYYAALADDFELANIEFSRPTRVELLDIERNPSGSLLLSLRFVGENDLPLRWWNAVLLRTDEWRWDEGRWWVVPGKI